MGRHVFSYDPYDGNSIERQRKANFQIMPKQTTEAHDGHRFCECCRKRKPVNGLPHRKGWKCNDCIAEEKPVLH